MDLGIAGNISMVASVYQKLPHEFVTRAPASIQGPLIDAEAAAAAEAAELLEQHDSRSSDSDSGRGDSSGSR